MPEWQTLFSVLREHDVIVSTSDMPRPVGGGDISAAWRAKTKDRAVFLKTGTKSSLAMFQAEARVTARIVLDDAWLLGDHEHQALTVANLLALALGGRLEP
jgi:fructosamine-3-kinase